MGCGCAAVREAMFIRDVMLFADVRVTLYGLMGSAATRGICKRDGIGRKRYLCGRFLRLHTLCKQGIVTVATVRTEINMAVSGSKPMSSDKINHIGARDMTCTSGNECFMFALQTEFAQWQREHFVNIEDALARPW